jgi:N-acyl-D-amino-acid deacylase
MNRREFLKNSGKAAAGLAALSTPLSVFASPQFDVLIKGGMILDGTGGPVWKADLGITGDSIAALDSIPSTQAAKVIDASGLYICPGFVDIHTHSDSSIASYPTADSRVRQGITTEITGNCGYSAAPLTGVNAEKRRKAMKEEDGVEAAWSTVASYFELLEKMKFSVNHALLLGQGTLRESIVGEDDRKATPDEIRALLRAVEEGLDQGAIGLSTGLEYAPGLFTPTEEIVEMARVVARRNGLYASHIRNEEKQLLDAIREAIDIGRRAGVRVEISHLKAAGRVNWGLQREAISLIENARKDGIEVLADAYPYTAYSTGLTVLFLPWVLDGGAGRMMERLASKTDRERIRKELVEYVTNDPGDYDLIVISDVNGARNKNCVGKNIVEISKMWNMEPVDVILRLIEEDQGGVSYVGHGMSPENVKMVLSSPLVMIGSDGYSIAPTGRAAESKPHPRSYGTYPRVLGYYARDEKTFDLPVAVKKMTSMPAEQAGLRDRGRIAHGKKADLVVFDAKTVKDIATFEDPQRYPAGILHVLVNGVPVVTDGAHTGARPGRILRS